MKKYTILFIIILYYSFCYTQISDTLYYDKDYQKCTKNLAFVYGFQQFDTLFSGIETYYYMNGQLHSITNYLYGSSDGSVKWWYMNGQIKCEGFYKKGIENGHFIYYYSNGNKKEEGFIQNGNKAGIWDEWDENGNRICNYHEMDIKPLFNNAKNEKTSKKLFSEYLENNVQYPEIAINNAIEGKMFVELIINEEGQIENVIISESTNRFMEEEVKRVLLTAPKWTIPMYKNKPTKVRLTFPYNFKLI